MGGTGFYKKYEYAGGKIDKFTTNFPPADGFYAFSASGKNGNVTDPINELYGDTGYGPMPTHAVVKSKQITYYNFDPKTHKFDEGLPLTKEDLIEGAKSQDWVIVFDGEDLPKQLGGTNTDYLPADQGGTGAKSDGGDGSKKKKDSGMPSWAIGALVVGAIYLLTKKKGA